MSKNLIIIFLLCISSNITQAQIENSTKKKINATKINEVILIDGNLNEVAWENAEIANNFIMFEPDNGKPIDESKKTEVKVLYDDDGIYIAAKLYDNEVDKISKEITERDDFGTMSLERLFGKLKTYEME